jgi:hypothetical protein
MERQVRRRTEDDHGRQHAQRQVCPRRQRHQRPQQDGDDAVPDQGVGYVARGIAHAVGADRRRVEQLGTVRAVEVRSRPLEPHLQRADREVRQQERGHDDEERAYRPLPDRQNRGQHDGYRHQHLAALAQVVEHPGQPVQRRRAVGVHPVGETHVECEQVALGQRDRQRSERRQHGEIKPPTRHGTGPCVRCHLIHVLTLEVAGQRVDGEATGPFRDIGDI